VGPPRGPSRRFWWQGKPRGAEWWQIPTAATPSNQYWWGKVLGRDPEAVWQLMDTGSHHVSSKGSIPFKEIAHHLSWPGKLWKTSGTLLIHQCRTWPHRQFCSSEWNVWVDSIGGTLLIHQCRTRLHWQFCNCYFMVTTLEIAPTLPNKLDVRAVVYGPYIPQLHQDVHQMYTNVGADMYAILWQCFNQCYRWFSSWKGSNWRQRGGGTTSGRRGCW